MVKKKKIRDIIFILIISLRVVMQFVKLDQWLLELGELLAA